VSKTAVIIPIETKSREFHGKLFLALHLLRAGHPVLVGDQARLWDYCDLVEPALYVDKSVASTRTPWFTRCRAMGHEVVSWDEEGLVFFDPWMYRKLRIDPAAFEQVSRFFAWGAVQRDAICEEYPDYRERIVLCGNPRFDFLRPSLRAFYRPAAEALRRRFGPMLLVNTNFAFYNHFKSATELRSMLMHYPLAQEPGYMDGWIDMHRQAHEAYLAMVPQLLSRYPDHTVVVRPHPSESHAPWRDLARAHPRLHVDASGNVHEWILASEAILHFNCTTAIEAYLLGVPPIAYRPGRFPRYENPLPYALSENAFSLRELWAALDGRSTARARGALWTAEQDHAAARYMEDPMGPRTAASRVVEEMNPLLDRARPVWGRGQHVGAWAKRQYRMRLHRLREMRNPPDGYAAQKFPGMRAAEISDTLRSMSEVSGVRANFTLEPFARDCYWLRPA
jgi:surface carbohydrate biosynthesis protein